jgi:hypothetical protein
MDIFRMNQETVYYQLKELLSDENIALLKEWNNEQINRKIVVEINRYRNHCFILSRKTDRFNDANNGQ